MPIHFFSPATLKTGYRWYIEFSQTHPHTGEVVRHRKTFKLNRIKDLSVRRKMAQHWVKKINNELPAGYPYEELYQGDVGQSLTVDEAIQIALDIKLQSPREQTHSTYKSVAKLLRIWTKNTRQDKLAVQLLTPASAQRWLDWLKSKREVGNRTHNNYLSAAKSFWADLERREYIEKNPWKLLKPLRAEEKRRRPFTPVEISIVSKWLRENDSELTAFVLHVYYGALRPAELLRLKVKDVNYADGVVTVPVISAKTWRERFVTIPREVCPYLEKRVAGANPDWFLFGSGLRVAPKKTSKSLPPGRHRKALDACLPDAKDVSLYSWKDSGLTKLANEINPLSAQIQAGHKDPKITSVYIEKPKFNPRIATMKDSFLSD